MYEKAAFISRNWRKENSTVGCWSSPINILSFEFINRINEEYDFMILLLAIFY